MREPEKESGSHKKGRESFIGKISSLFYKPLSAFALDGWLDGHSLRVASQSSTSFSRVA
jgi:hypothetical protein